MPTNFRWINQSQPRFMVNATVLFYMNAVFAVLFGEPVFMIKIVKLLGIAAGLGLANEKKWGYYLACICSVVPLLGTIYEIAVFGLNVYDFSSLIITLLFQLLLIALVFHPTSRSYQRIWFK